MSDKVKDIIIRALKTFWQAGIAFLIAEIAVFSDLMPGTDTFMHVCISVGVGALAAGLSAVWNGIVTPLLTSNETIEEVEELIEDTAFSTFLESLGINLSEITVEGLKKVAETVGAAIESTDNKSTIIAKIEAILNGTEETEESTE